MKVTERFIGHLWIPAAFENLALHPNQSIQFVFCHGELYNFYWVYDSPVDS